MSVNKWRQTKRKESDTKTTQHELELEDTAGMIRAQEGLKCADSIHQSQPLCSRQTAVL
jgi:hypothetical protein